MFNNIFTCMIDKLMIVAHPDDEALFGGAELLTHSDEYKVVVVEVIKVEKIIIEKNLSMNY